MINDWRVHRINEVVKKHDRTLFAYRVSNGMIQVWRKGERSAWDFFVEGDKPVGDQLQFILPLTEDWTLQGKPVDWGLEPVVQKLQEMDNWTNPEAYNQFDRERYLKQGWKEQSRSNEYRAIAGDLRKDVAKATNDLIVSSL